MLSWFAAVENPRLVIGWGVSVGVICCVQRTTCRRARPAAAAWAQVFTTRPSDLALMNACARAPCVLLLVPARARAQAIGHTVRGTRARSKHSRKNARSQTEPWLLAASCSLRQLSAAAIAARYAQRMQIEPSFRDTKNARWGLGPEHRRYARPSAWPCWC